MRRLPVIVRYYEYFLPECDCCGHLLPAEHSTEDAEAAMRRDGWGKRDGKDVCRVCLLHERETGHLPERMRFFIDGR
jgi:hypothetical protein